jgi:putative Mn2+ efflux pump MntP
MVAKRAKDFLRIHQMMIRKNCTYKNGATVTFLNILAIAIALAMDAFAVSVASGVCLGVVNARQTFRMAWHFGFFQAAMPIIGWAGGLTVRDAIGTYAHWVAFGLLAFVAIKMIKDAFIPEPDGYEKDDPTKGWSLIMLSVATSIDALAVGFSISMLDISIWYPAAVIGVVAGSFTLAGLHLGCKIGSFQAFRGYAHLAGGVVLLGIGAKILYDHGGFGF